VTQPQTPETQGAVTPAKTTGGSTPVTCPRPGLRVSLTGPARVIAGQQAVLSLRVENRGRIVARNVLVADMLPEGFALVKSSKPHVFRSGALRVRIGTLRPGAAFTLRLTTRVSRSAAGRQVNLAQATAQCAQAAASRPIRVNAVEGALTPAVTG
jgi:uncharacterized repeat protein (TIGR01451 family)